MFRIVVSLFYRDSYGMIAVVSRDLGDEGIVVDVMVVVTVLS